MPIETYHHTCGHERTVIVGEPHPMTSPSLIQFLRDRENTVPCPECRAVESGLPECEMCGALMETDGVNIYCPYCGMDDIDDED